MCLSEEDVPKFEKSGKGGQKCFAFVQNQEIMCDTSSIRARTSLIGLLTDWQNVHSDQMHPRTSQQQVASIRSGWWLIRVHSGNHLLKPDS